MSNASEQRAVVAMVFSLLVLSVSCRDAKVEQQQTPRPQPATLPAGDPVAGKQAFVEMRCWSCHEVYGGDMPQPVAEPRMPVYIGGNVRSEPDDLYLLRAIAAPSHELAKGWGTEGVQSGTLSRMGDYSRVMTVRQLLDVIAFIKSRYGAGAEEAVRRQKEAPASQAP